MAWGDDNKLYSFTVGLDIGGTHVRSGISVDDSLIISDYEKALLGKYETPEIDVENNICRAIDRQILSAEKNGGVLEGIGIALAAVLDKTEGTVDKWPNHPLWNGFPLMKYLKNKYDVPLHIEDDANCGAVGELAAGAGKDCENLLYIAVGTGIGCGIVINRRLFKGDNGLAGEAGHVRLWGLDSVCSCGRKGCLQAEASGLAISNKIKKKYECSYSTHKKQPLYSELDISCYIDAAEKIGYFLANTVLLLDIDNIVIGGGVMDVGDFYISTIIEAVDSNLGNIYQREINIMKSQLGDQSNLIGAIHLAKCLYK